MSITRITCALRAFDAEVVAIEGAPPKLVLTTPVEARRAERHRHQRIRVDYPVQACSWIDNSRSLHLVDSATITDLSIGGLRMRLSDDIEVGAETTIQLQFTRAGLIEAIGSVVGVQTARSTDAVDVSIQFTDLDEFAFEQIELCANAALRKEQRAAS